MIIRYTLTNEGEPCLWTTRVRDGVVLDSGKYVSLSGNELPVITAQTSCTNG